MFVQCMTKQPQNNHTFTTKNKFLGSTHARTHTQHTRTHARMHARTHAHTHTHTHTHTHSHTHSLIHSLTHQAMIKKKTVSARSITSTQPMWKSSSMVSGCRSVSRVSPSCLTSHSETRVTPIPIHVFVNRHSPSFPSLQIDMYVSTQIQTL